MAPAGADGVSQAPKRKGDDCAGSVGESPDEAEAARAVDGVRMDGVVEGGDVGGKGWAAGGELPCEAAGLAPLCTGVRGEATATGGVPGEDRQQEERPSEPRLRESGGAADRSSTQPPAG